MKGRVAVRGACSVGLRASVQQGGNAGRGAGSGRHRQQVALLQPLLGAPIIETVDGEAQLLDGRRERGDTVLVQRDLDHTQVPPRHGERAGKALRR